jgi:glutamate synthase domain-containing protein 2/glutamate synthase domain-containing protein 1/glutamate synthase domain-containing protein 3
MQHESGASPTANRPTNDFPTARPAAAGLHDPALEHDACGVGFVARLDSEPVHDVVERALVVLENMEHRGAEGADPETGDGAGILLQLPDEFLRAACDFELPSAGDYGVAMCFLPSGEKEREWLKQKLEQTVDAEGLTVLGWRDVPTDRRHAGRAALATAPYIKQMFIGAGGFTGDQDAFERKLYVARRVFEHEAGEDAQVISMSSRTIAYKGMLSAPQLPGYFPDLRDPRIKSQVAVVHSRFSTNTFPTWSLAHPFRMLAHNGEINTLRGNHNWMRAREGQLHSELFGDEVHKLHEVVRPGGSDSAALDNVLELLVLAGRSVPHALMMLIPEAYSSREEISPAVKDFYHFNACMMEPWDGPAAVAFTDGRCVGAMLDRNGLRPGRWVLTKDGYAIMASESGVLPVEPENVERKGRLRPGKFFFIDLVDGRVVENGELKEAVATQQPYEKWCREQILYLADIPDRGRPAPSPEPLHTRQLAFGYSQEDLRVLLEPMVAAQAEPIGSMGNDLALAVLSDRQPSLFTYFKQLFAQVTNPPIDPLREQLVMSLVTRLGRRGNIFTETPEHAAQLLINQPILGVEEMEKLRHVDRDGYRSRTIDITWPVADGPAGMESALLRACDEARTAVDEGVTMVILSDRGVNARRAPIPSLLATSAVHQHLVREGVRLRVGLIIETGEPREIHHLAALIGFGAAAVHPYLALESLVNLYAMGHMPEEMDVNESEKRLIRAFDKGLLKVISKMGISTIQSYRGAQLFEALGLDEELIEKYFTGTPSRIGGVGIRTLAREALERHARGYANNPEYGLLPVGGVYQWRRQGERRVWSPAAVSKLQNAVGLNPDATPGPVAYQEFADAVNDETTGAMTLRGLLDFKTLDEPLPLEEIEPIEEIVKRFSTGAISLGAISTESHEAMAVAMNRLGARSNTGEGGEDAQRFADDRRSAIKQIASGRFGVTIDYLANADQLQIKIAQGAKPGEGGQLPGPKVSPFIAKLRHSTPGVGLISPPPHHDIYSIEDLKQLIHDLRCANPGASVSVKLVAAAGVGTVAAGVAKAGADHVVIAGHEGGTGASPQSSIYNVGLPWEIGLAETQQTLLANDLRSRIAVEVDGSLKTGRDVAVAALLGADQFGFATAPLIAMGCIMMRVCHLNTCPVGIATQNPELRRRFRGKPEHVVNYLLGVAGEVREIMAAVGVRRFDDLIGRSDLLVPSAGVAERGGKPAQVDLANVIRLSELPDGAPRHFVERRDPGLEGQLDWRLLEQAEEAIASAKPVMLESPINNVDRAVGGVLSNAIALQHGATGLPAGTIKVAFTGSAGQSFGAWLAPGVEFTVDGDANDYAGKGLSGGTIAIRPPAGSSFVADRNVIVGNAVLYGATGGKAFFSGQAGERFAVRNSGAVAVVEGVGDHGCEYMTGGRVTVLGPTGENFAAGMSGGIALVYDPGGRFENRLNRELVELEGVEGEDAQQLYRDLTEHVEATGSMIARRILDAWPVPVADFVMVMPSDYKRALEELAQKAERVSPEGATFGRENPPDTLGTPPARAELALPYHDALGNTEDLPAVLTSGVDARTAEQAPAGEWSETEPQTGGPENG